MRKEERRSGLAHSPKLAFNVLFLGRYDFIYDQIPISLRRMSLAKRVNLFRAGINMVHRRQHPWSMPIHMQFELTNYCNLRCPVCPTGRRTLSREATTMPPELFRHIFQEVGPYLMTASLWGWGEPLLHPDLDKILAAAQEHNVAVFLSTNGQNLENNDILEALLEKPPTHLIVAIDGLTDKTNSIFRIGAKLAPALEGVRQLAERKRQTGGLFPILHMRYILMRHNQHEAGLLIDFARESGFDALSTRTLSIIDAEQPDALCADFRPDEKDYAAYQYSGDSRIHRRDFICQQPFWFPSVFADGTLVACDQDYNAQQPLGRISEDVSFSKVWYGEQAEKVRRIIRDKPEILSFCRNCPFCDRPATDVSIQFSPTRPEMSDPLVL